MKQIRLHGRGGQGVVTAAELIAIAAYADAIRRDAAFLADISSGHAKPNPKPSAGLVNPYQPASRSER